MRRPPWVLDPEVDSADVSARLREFVGCNAVKAEVDDGAQLSVTFEGGAELQVAPDPWYESWTVTGPNGFMVVCMPGGQLATWKGEDPT